MEGNQDCFGKMLILPEADRFGNRVRCTFTPSDSWNYGLKVISNIVLQLPPSPGGIP